MTLRSKADFRIKKKFKPLTDQFKTQYSHKRKLLWLLSGYLCIMGSLKRQADVSLLGLTGCLMLQEMLHWLMGKTLLSVSCVVIKWHLKLKFYLCAGVFIYPLFSVCLWWLPLLAIVSQCIEQLGRIQAELQDSVKDLAKSKKKYFEMEQMAQAVREKADIEAK